MDKEKAMSVDERINDGSINEQSIWQYLKERASADPARPGKTAIIDSVREYSYEQMFTEWERYARVFSALGMDGEHNSRVGIAGTITAEPLFAFYGLNMTGATVSMLSYPDFLPSGQWRTMVEKEKISDLVLSDIMITPEMWPELEKAKEELGLRNIIFLHSRLGGICTGPAELFYNEFNYHMLKRTAGTVFMDELLEEYADHEISYSSGDPDHMAVIMHTSGTTKGTRKPLPYAERSVNTVSTNFGSGFRALISDIGEDEQLRLAPSFDFSSFMCMCGIVNSSFAIGECVVLTFFGFMHPRFIRAIDHYKVNVLFTSGFMIDGWIARSDIDDVDLSAVKVFSCGGSYMPPEKLKKYKEFVKKHGYEGYISRGYGMSESGGAQLMVPPGNEEDILGFPYPKGSFIVQDEDDGKFYSAEDGVRTGVMYIASDSLCMNELDGEVLFEFTKVDGQDFICSNDLVRVNEDGSFSYAGRADRYFVNNDGVRFEAGLAETEMSRQAGIDKCAVVPVLDKRIHDTVPVLYIITDEKGDSAPETVRRALVNVFANDGPAAGGSLPSQFVLADDIPCNANGKIDIYRITRERLKGEAYNILPVREDGRLTDIGIEYADQLDSITGGTLPEGMGGGSALGIYDIFNQAPLKKKRPLFPDPFRLFGSRPDMNSFFKNRRKFQMFDFYDSQKNPFMFMMNMAENMENNGDKSGDADFGRMFSAFGNAGADPMQLMQHAFMLQMQMMQAAFMLPAQLMSGFSDMMSSGAFPGFSEKPEEKSEPSAQEGFKLGNMNIPPELLGKIMQMDMSPENLEKLQKVLDFVFETMPEPQEKKD